VNRLVSALDNEAAACAGRCTRLSTKLQRQHDLRVAPRNSSRKEPVVLTIFCLGADWTQGSQVSATAKRSAERGLVRGAGFTASASPATGFSVYSAGGLV
jgi:hypothetical protein